MYKLILIDLDGTLLNSFGIVTERTKEVIKKTINKGIDVVITSGRSVTEYMKYISKEVGCKNYFIAGNGALIYDIKNNQALYKNYMSKEKVIEIAKICEENNIFYNVYTEDSIITKKLNHSILFYHKENLKKAENKRTKINIIDNPYTYIRNDNNHNYLKMTICDEDKEVFNSILKKFKNIKNVKVLEPEYMTSKKIMQGTEKIPINYFYTEITTENVDKWNATHFLINKLEIKPEEVIAIGDNINDLTMIKNAGLGVAMGESMPVLKENADYVTEDNNNDGVAIAIEKFL